MKNHHLAPLQCFAHGGLYGHYTSDTSTIPVRYVLDISQNTSTPIGLISHLTDLMRIRSLPVVLVDSSNTSTQLPLQPLATKAHQVELSISGAGIIQTAIEQRLEWTYWRRDDEYLICVDGYLAALKVAPTLKGNITVPQVCTPHSDLLLDMTDLLLDLASLVHTDLGSVLEVDQVEFFVTSHPPLGLQDINSELARIFETEY